MDGLTLLLAPAGYGKTTLLRQWIASNRNVAVVSLDRTSRDVAALGRDVALSLDAFYPGLVQILEGFISGRSKPNSEPEEAARIIADRLYEPMPTLVVDDYHEIIGTEAERLVVNLHRQAGMKLIIASRIRPIWATARLAVYGSVVEITREQLAMSEPEAADLLQSTSIANRKLATQAQGWPALLSLAARSSRSKAPKDLLPSTLHQFFADELFDGVSPETQDALIHFALLPLMKLNDSLHPAWSSREVANVAAELGFASWVDGQLEMHPLLRDFLLSKLATRFDPQIAVDEAVSAALDAGEHDAANNLVVRFGFLHRLDDLITASFNELVRKGRIATIEEIAEFSHRSGRHPTPLVDLLDAEILFRGGLHERAEHVAVRSATALTAEGHGLAARAWWLAGAAAHLVYQDARARDHLIQARNLSRDEVERGEAIWTLALSALSLEEPSLISEALDELEQRKDRSPLDLVRWASGNLMRGRMGEGLRDTPSLELGLHAAARVMEPHARTGFMMLCAYHRGLQGAYEDCEAKSRKLIEEAAGWGLGFVRPHALMALALALIGSREIVEADAALTEVEEVDGGRDPFFKMNVAMLRARIALQQGRFNAALEILPRAPDFPIPAIRAECLALRGVAKLAAGDLGGTLICVERARGVSRGVESAFLSSMIHSAVLASRGRTSESLAAFDKTWAGNGGDAILTVLRIDPTFTALLIHERRSAVAELALRAGDSRLARATGQSLAPRSSIHPLSPREREVGELLCAGLSNKEIGRALFISESTAKLHVRHILAKLKVQSRTQAVVSLRQIREASRT